MTDVPLAPALPGTGFDRRRRARVALTTLLALVLAQPAAAVAQPSVRVAAARTLARPSVPTAEQAAAVDAPTAAAPDPRLAPDEVVGIVLDALAQASDRPAADRAPSDRLPTDRPRADSAAPTATEHGDAGPFALLFAFASPGNRAALGSPDRFGAMVRDEAFRPLLAHRRAVRGALRVHGDRATQRVLVTSARGERVAYTFVLARQGAGAQRGCWLTESVTREAPSRLATPASA